MKATNITASKTLRILNNIIEGYTEWFAKDEHHSASLEYSRIGYNLVNHHRLKVDGL